MWARPVDFQPLIDLSIDKIERDAKRTKCIELKDENSTIIRGSDVYAMSGNQYPNFQIYLEGAGRILLEYNNNDEYTHDYNLIKTILLS